MSLPASAVRSDARPAGTLFRLHGDARRLITPDLVSGQLEFWPGRAYQELLEVCPVSFDLSELDHALDAVIAKTPRFDPSIDRLAAPAIHRALPLGRRLAADKSLWRFLTVVHRPDFVRHRWENRSFTQTRERFWAAGTSGDSNAIGRLWWIAELTRDGRDYTLTERVLSRPVLANPLFSRKLSWYRPAVEACADVIGDAPKDRIEQALRLFNKSLSVIVLESRNAEQLRELLRELCARIGPE
jgi:hypothetical protein